MLFLFSFLHGLDSTSFTSNVVHHCLHRSLRVLVLLAFLIPCFELCTCASSAVDVALFRDDVAYELESRSYTPRAHEFVRGYTSIEYIVQYDIILALLGKYTKLEIETTHIEHVSSNHIDEQLLQFVSAHLSWTDLVMEHMVNLVISSTLELGNINPGPDKAK